MYEKHPQKNLRTGEYTYNITKRLHSLKCTSNNIFKNISGWLSQIAQHWSRVSNDILYRG